MAFDISFQSILNSGYCVSEHRPYRSWCRDNWRY
ncbi:uncharacterized protein FIBRA_09412 [Fibroporia radiculosa]|uniref:Uncharacterized protein n=1 Tax=Fibroporia radiculosa TaxID=599839 RepID=J7SCD7_9APHY|nr:uncharacterized protein FIBRA_09412 [Fibroporia radiculosa]CCM07086.1 predicted protein [Fibroporia radiculosa]